MESRCQSLQEKVDGFLTEMANSEHADVLLCHVEHLEKDRTSLQTVLEMKTLEVNQLRTKLNEQIVQVKIDFVHWIMMLIVDFIRSWKRKWPYRNESIWPKIEIKI